MIDRAAPELADIARRGLFRAWGESGRRAWIRSSGRSMTPLVPPGADLLVAFGPAPARVGAVVVREVGGRIVAHRIVRVHGDGRVVTKGDAEPFPDPDAGTDEAVLGAVVAVRRAGARRAHHLGLDGRSGALLARASMAGRQPMTIGRRLVRRGPGRNRIGWGLVRLARLPVRLTSAAITRLDRGHVLGEEVITHV